MKSPKILLFTMALIGFCFSANAQSRLKLTDLYLTSGISGTSAAPLNSWEINNLERGLFSPSNLRPEQVGTQGRLNGRFNAHIGMLAGYTIKGTRLGQQKLRIGLSAGIYSVDWNSYRKSSQEYRVDTLISQQTGDEYYIDSTRVKNLSYEHHAQMFNLHADYLVYINPRNKLTFYTGVGARFGVSLHNSVSASYHEYSIVDGPIYEKDDYKRYAYNGYDNDYTRTTKTLAPTTNLNAHVILGLNYRLSKKNRYLKNIHLFHEVNLGMQLNNMEAIETSLGFNAGVQAGARLSINKRSVSNKKYKRQRPRRKRY